jgi:hypothetical protein
MLIFECVFQAHFDCLPPDCKVVDGARFRWCPLLLLDAVLYLLSHNGFQFPTRRAFCQQKVLYECILAELEESDNALFSDLFNKRYTAILKDAIKAVEFQSEDEEEDDDVEDSRFDDEEKVRVRENVTLEFALRFSDVFPRMEFQQSNPNWASVSNLRAIALEDPPSKSKQKFITIVDFLSHHHAFYLPLPRVSVDVIFKAIICKVLAYFGTSLDPEDSDSEDASLVHAAPRNRPNLLSRSKPSQSYSVTTISPVPREKHPTRRDKSANLESTKVSSKSTTVSAHLAMALKRPLESRAKPEAVKAHRTGFKQAMTGSSSRKLTSAASDDLMERRHLQYWQDIRARRLPQRSMSLSDATVARPATSTIRRVEEMSPRTIPRQYPYRSGHHAQLAQQSTSHHPMDFFPRYSSLSSDDLLVYPNVFEERESSLAPRQFEDTEFSLDPSEFNNGIINSAPFQRDFCLQLAHQKNESATRQGRAAVSETNMFVSSAPKHDSGCCSRCSCRLSLASSSAAHPYINSNVAVSSSSALANNDHFDYEDSLATRRQQHLSSLQGASVSTMEVVEAVEYFQSGDDAN